MYERDFTVAHKTSPRNVVSQIYIYIHPSRITRDITAIERKLQGGVPGYRRLVRLAHPLYLIIIPMSPNRHIHRVFEDTIIVYPSFSPFLLPFLFALTDSECLIFFSTIVIRTDSFNEKDSTKDSYTYTHTNTNTRVASYYVLATKFRDRFRRPIA